MALEDRACAAVAGEVEQLGEETPRKDRRRPQNPGVRRGDQGPLRRRCGVEQARKERAIDERLIGERDEEAVDVRSEFVEGGHRTRQRRGEALAPVRILDEVQRQISKELGYRFSLGADHHKHRARTARRELLGEVADERLASPVEQLLRAAETARAAGG